MNVDVSRRDTTLVKTLVLRELPADFVAGRRASVHRAMTIRIAETRRDRAFAADVVKRRHYAGRWPCRPRTLILSYLAELLPGTPAGLAMVALLPGRYHAAEALGVRKYEALQLVRVWRADDLVPTVAPDFSPEFLRRVVRRLRDDWTARKLRPGGLRAVPRLLLSYADPARGHDGGLYVGAGATFCGPAASGRLLFAWSLEEQLALPLHQLGLAAAERAASRG